MKKLNWMKRYAFFLLVRRLLGGISDILNIQKYLIKSAILNKCLDLLSKDIGAGVFSFFRPLVTKSISMKINDAWSDQLRLIRILMNITVHLSIV